MNGLDKIIEKIISDAKERAKAYEQEATAEIAKMKDEAVDEIMRMESVYMSRAEKAWADMLSRAESSSELEARNIILKRKTELIAQAFEKAIAKLAALPSGEYVSLIADALAHVVNERREAKNKMRELYGDEEAELDVVYEVMFNKADLEGGNAKKIFDTAKKHIDKSVKLAMSTLAINIDGGFVLKCNDIEINCSLSSLVNDARTRCEAKVIKALF